MEIIQIVTGTLEENCYIITDNKNCLVIDPGDDGKKIKETIGDKKILAVLLTHSHFDHIGALRDVIGKKSIPILKHRILEEKEYTYGPFSFDVIFTPGHSSDSVTYYFKNENVMFSGDFVFEDSIGRCDLPTGSMDDMKKSIVKIKEYPKDTTMHPGHGKNITIEHLIKDNPYFQL